MKIGVSDTGKTTESCGTLKCYHCNVDPVVMRHCKAVAIYVLSDNGMSRLFLHQGTHYHPIGEGLDEKCLRIQDIWSRRLFLKYHRQILDRCK